jgi:predicted RNase H-like nuclease
LKFLGIDLAWKVANPASDSTALCTLDSNGNLQDLVTCTSDLEVLGSIEEDVVWIGIDAPLRVPYDQGMRHCERSLRSMNVRVLPSNRKFMTAHFGGLRGEAMTNELQLRGYAPAEGSGSAPKAFFEVYPYGTLAMLTEGEVPPYKHGPAESRRAAMAEVLEVLRSWQPRMAVNGLPKEMQHARAKELKTLGDKIDAMLCAACLYAHWLSKGKSTALVGDEKEGFILLPLPGR